MYVNVLAFFFFFYGVMFFASLLPSFQFRNMRVIHSPMDLSTFSKEKDGMLW